MGFSVQMRRLRGVSDEVLKREALRWRDRERRQTAGLMAHLAEIDRRELYAAWGYSSLFAYCDGALGLTEAEAYLRIQVARTAGRCPAILDRLVSGAMTLSVAAVISPVLTVENADEVLDRASGMTKVEAKELVVEYRPKPRVEPGVRKRPASGKAVQKAALREMGTQVGLLGEGSGSELTAGDDLGCGDRETELERPQVPAGKLEPVERDLYNFRFCADRELKERIERLGEVLGVLDPFGSLDRIVSEAVEVLLDKKDPEPREARRKQRAARKVGTVEARDEESSGDSFRTESVEVESIEAESEPANSPQAESVQVGLVQTESGSSRSRAIAIGVRDRVLGRSGFQCEFVHEGRRCQERTGLEVDHVVPYGRGGSNRESNLQVLCGSHNRWKAKQEYGRSYIEGKIAAARGGLESAELVREHRWEIDREAGLCPDGVRSDSPRSAPVEFATLPCHHTTSLTLATRFMNNPGLAIHRGPACRVSNHSFPSCLRMTFRDGLSKV